MAAEYFPVSSTIRASGEERNKNARTNESVECVFFFSNTDQLFPSIQWTFVCDEHSNGMLFGCVNAMSLQWPIFYLQTKIISHWFENRQQHRMPLIRVFHLRLDNGWFKLFACSDSKHFEYRINFGFFTLLWPFKYRHLIRKLFKMHFIGMFHLFPPFKLPTHFNQESLGSAFIPRASCN